ncbi:hypothetical protein JA1_004175 [Spathaspora sp. JA1]|nr:hypothetical protein JA1_004175 [Spathaspora sp. JA1]
MSLKQANAKYVQCIIKYPLLTKAITGAILNGLNEIISTTVTSDYSTIEILGYKVNHVLSPKLIKMIIYGGLISTPTSHYMYHIINNKIFTGNLSKLGKILQILTSLFTVTPTICGIFVSWVSLINNYQVDKGEFNLCKEVSKMVNIVKTGLKRGYKGILKTAMVTSLMSLIIAQNYIPQELWVVFFSSVSFVLGTIQNIKLKKLQKQARLDKEEKSE